MQTNVIACRWRRTDDGWTLWVAGRQDVRGSGPTYEAAEEALVDAIIQAAPDADAVMPVVPEFDPPLPATAFAEPYLNPELYIVRGDAIFELGGPADCDEDNAEERDAYLNSLYSGGICGACRHGRGERTDVPLHIRAAPAGVDAGWVRGRISDRPRIFSERVVESLTESERERLMLRPAVMPPRTRRRFYELGGRAGVDLVGVRGLDADGLECTQCGRRSLRVLDPRLMEGGLHLTRFVCATDLPADLRNVFLVGSGVDVDLCMLRARWDLLRGRARGLMTEPVGVVKADDCDRRPRVRNRRDRCQVCAAWPAPLAIDGKQRAVFELPAQDCSFRNFTWIPQAEKSGYLQISRSTTDVMTILEAAQQSAPPKRIDFISFRCPNCWRLGWVVLTRKELRLLWEHGLA
jgi:hypothetical protein